MKFHTLNEWLAWQEGLNPKEISLGLERTRAVWARLPQFDSATTIITVAGTNGKGSSVALLESILESAGYVTGCYTSPHLLRYNERIRVARLDASDKKIMQAFELIETAREDIPLTYFEYGTLAALVIFVQAEVNVVLLEVGLGGRLDAVNILDAHAGLIASIDLDHQNWLGDDRESIGYEKAGIFRSDSPAVFSGKDIPDSIMEYAEKLGTPLSVYAQDYDFEVLDNHWNLTKGEANWRDLPLPSLQGEHQIRNAAGVLVLLDGLKHRMAIKRSAIEKGLRSVQIPGRSQWIPGAVSYLLDVAHNPDAVAMLHHRLDQIQVRGRVYAVLGMLNDKNAQEVIEIMKGRVHHWAFADLHTERGFSASDLHRVAVKAKVTCLIQEFSSVNSAIETVKKQCKDGDLVLIFGSFHTVGEGMQSLGYNDQIQTG